MRSHPTGSRVITAYETAIQFEYRGHTYWVTIPHSMPKEERRAARYQQHQQQQMEIDKIIRDEEDIDL